MTPLRLHVFTIAVMMTFTLIPDISSFDDNAAPGQRTFGPPADQNGGSTAMDPPNPPGDPSKPDRPSFSWMDSSEESDSKESKESKKSSSGQSQKKSKSKKPQSVKSRHEKPPADGNCSFKREYVITEVRDLEKHKSGLKCIYRQGSVPNKVPEGSLRGTVLSVFDQDFLNPFANFMWNGKIIIEARCNDKLSYIGWNNLGSSPAFPFTARIDSLNEDLERGEHEDERDTIIMDYTKDFARVCPEFKSISKSKDVMHNLFNVDTIVNVMRIVGEKKDGSSIYLGKTYMRNKMDGSKRSTMVAYFAATNYDPKISSRDLRDDREDKITKEVKESSEAFSEQISTPSSKQPPPI